MGRWTAVLGKMRTAGSRRIDRREAERLLSGGPVHPDRAGLTELLDLVAAPARPEELAGRQDAVAAFQRIRHQTPVVPAPRRRRRLLSTLSRAAVIKLAAGLVILLAGGTALAAGTGHLPRGFQHGAHELLAPFGVSVPDAASASPSASRRGAGSPSPSLPPRPGPGAVASPTDPVAVGLCRDWADQRRKNGKVPNTPEMRVLAEAAGGVDNIPAYCAPVLNETQASPTPAPSDPDGGPKPKPSHPGPDKTKVHPTHP
jgi:hypothetical protein